MKEPWRPEGRKVGPGFDPLPVVLGRLQQLETQGQAIAASGSPHFREVASTLRLLGHQGQELKAAWEQDSSNCRRLELQKFGRGIGWFHCLLCQP